MIETREQYEEIRKGWHFAGSNSQVVAANAALVKTIEALRGLAKGITGTNPYIPSETDGELYCYWCGAYDVEDHDAECEYRRAKELPDWITKDD